MRTRIRWGILGPGRIATRFATDLRNSSQAELVAVGSRSADRSAEFALQFGARKAYGSYAELAADPDVDAVYVATPHPFHCELTLLCLEHGKAVLCEKPMGINEREVCEMANRARQKKTLLMEAMWTRLLPVTLQVKQWLASQAIGDVRMVIGDFGFCTAWDPAGRWLNPSLAGGALLDVGVYTVAYASMVFGTPPAHVLASAHIGPSGVDEQTAMLFTYPGGALALLSCAVRTNTPQEVNIQGTEGSIHIPAFWHATSATLACPGHDPVQTFGSASYHYEAAEVMSCLQAGQAESLNMPLEESIAIAHTLEQVRTAIGLRYPME
jgi:predicted dehydrogenase